MNVTIKQKEMLLSHLKENPDLVRGRINRKSESRRKMVESWDNIANIINAAAEGPQKNGKEWAKTWKDIKAYILKKESKRRSHIEGTGGGPPSKIIFSNFEEEVLELLTPESAGLLNIPEGGINIEATTSLQNDPENYINIEESVLNDCERSTEDTVTIEPQIERLHTEIYNLFGFVKYLM
ncbi:PREDICTED: uncharacterized protein LOC108762202 [Trachymyrmex cornetzi]|uniref:uncharacterized protein LOC108762202 n=1 Tax=Trachymyrmex cornetzi TaxID=471704 RepID=UPI00084EE6FD|nr:PREDICTED: uncharacterized protein LOC108762202 [Trachymyrmex cornetzi]